MAGRIFEFQNSFGMATTPFSAVEATNTEKEAANETNILGSQFSSDSEIEGLKLRSNSTTTNLVTEVIHSEDNPTLSPWTFRMWFLGELLLSYFSKQQLTTLLGLSLSLFASTVTTISTFKPQPIRINLVFLVVLSHVLGRGLERLIPRKGKIGRFLNPHAVSWSPWLNINHALDDIELTFFSSTSRNRQPLS